MKANVVDSSGWLEYFSSDPRGDAFAEPIMATDQLIVPTISIYEVYKRVSVLVDVERAKQSAQIMSRGRLIDLDAELAIGAAHLARAHGLAMADSIILATARRFDATLWTQDVDFEGIDGVRYLPRT